MRQFRFRSVSIDSNAAEFAFAGDRKELAGGAADGTRGRLAASEMAANCGPGRKRFIAFWLLCILLWGTTWPSAIAAQPQLEVKRSDGRIDFLLGDQPIASYFYLDPAIRRPYFAHLYAPGGLRVSRNHPPIEGLDKVDHPTFHPGLWLAFGDLSGADNWRLKAEVAHARFLEEPTRHGDRIGFAVENRYLSADDPPETICHERCRYELHVVDGGYLLTWDSTFFGDREFWFGDQEEMGLGIRVATPLRVEQGGDGLPDGTGAILDSQKRRNAAEVWGRSAKWVDYSGELEGVPAGISLFCHPHNYRPTRFHARDYGFIAANPFSMAAFELGRPQKTVVKPGASLRLRYGVLLHGGKSFDSAALDFSYLQYLKLATP